MKSWRLKHYGLRLQKIFGVEEPEKYINFERLVEVDDNNTGKAPPNSSTGTSPRRGY